MMFHYTQLTTSTNCEITLLDCHSQGGNATILGVHLMV